MSVRKEVIGLATLYLGDCREIVGALERPAAIITDPPYGIGYVRTGGGKKGEYRARSVSQMHGNDGSPIAGDAEPFNPAPWLTAADAVLLWGANHFAQCLPHGRWLAWNKLGGLEPWDSFSDVEFAWVNGRGADRIFSHLWKGLCQAGSGTRREHPTQKPVPLGKFCITQAKVPKGGVILDPYAGSGSFGVAAVEIGHPFVGIEIEKKYFDVMCRRVEQAQRQGDMFRDSI